MARARLRRAPSRAQSLGLLLGGVLLTLALDVGATATTPVGELSEITTAVRIAEPVRIQWTVPVPATTQIIDVTLRDAPHVELLDRSWSRVDATVIIEASVLIARPGTYTLGALEASLRTASGDDASLRSPPAEITVEAVSAPDERTEVALPMSATLPHVLHPVVPLSGGLVLLLTTLGFLTRRLLRPAAASMTEEEVPDPIDPFRYLRDTLDRLLAEADRSVEAPVDWHQELSDALRVYLALTSSPGAREQTTTEIATALRATHTVRPEHQTRLLQVLRATDQVKFGGFRPPRDWSVRVANDAEQLLERLEADRATAAAEADERRSEEAP